MTHNTLQYAANLETKRHNYENERLTEQEQAITKSHNEAVEAETKRHNLALEQQAYNDYLENQRRNTIQMQYNQQSIALTAERQAEEARHNYAMDSTNLLKASKDFGLNDLSSAVVYQVMSPTLSGKSVDISDIPGALMDSASSILHKTLGAKEKQPSIAAKIGNAIKSSAEALIANSSRQPKSTNIYGTSYYGIH